MKGELDDHHGLDMDIYTLRGQKERIKDLKQQLQDINNDQISVEDSEELEDRRANLEQLLYNLKINVDRLAGSKEEKPPLMTTGVTEMSSIRLPRIEIPAFNGNILNWRIFWEQFDSAIHSKNPTSLTEIS